MKNGEIRQLLIDGTIRVIARDGLEKASTKLIGTTTSINEVYIYRCFKSKEDMFTEVFSFLDDELVTKALQHIDVMYMEEFDYIIRCKIFFNSMWRFILSNHDKCVTYIRYYYSPYFRKFSAEKHKERFSPLLEKFKAAFNVESNVWMILNYILSTLLMFAVKVFDDAVPDDDDTAEHVFKIIYASIHQYLRESRN